MVLYHIDIDSGEIIRGSNGINPLDHSILFGMAIFETIRLKEANPLCIELHLDRLMESARNLSILPKCDYSSLLAVVSELIDTNKLEDCALRLTLTAGDPAHGVCQSIVFTWRTIPYSNNSYVNGFSVIQAPFLRNETSSLCSVKSCNLIELKMARDFAYKKRVDELIFVNTKGFIAEGSITNIFFVKDECIFTPSETCGILPGVTRKLVIRIAEKIGIPYLEGEFTFNQFEESDETFCTNSLMGVMPITYLKQKKKWDIGNITKAISHIYNSEIK